VHENGGGKVRTAVFLVFSTYYLLSDPLEGLGYDDCLVQEHLLQGRFSSLSAAANIREKLECH
jgi:hypothetical protein